MSEVPVKSELLLGWFNYSNPTSKFIGLAHISRSSIWQYKIYITKYILLETLDILLSNDMIFVLYNW
jgi:hypothetical protein